ncbi:MAG: M56 family metallopeptidase [Vicinamibacterales bacterium]
MTAIDILQQPIAQAVGWALLQFVWQGTLIGLVTAALFAALRRSAADIRYLVGTIAMSLMLTMPIVTTMQNFGGGAGGESTADATAGAISVERATERPVASADRAVAPAEGVPVAAAPGRPSFESWLPVLLSLWLVGVVMLTLRLLSGWIFAQRLKSRGAAAASAALDRLGQRLTRRLHILRTVRFLESSVIDVPTVIGWMKPVVLLPASALAALSPQHLEAILAHELAHIRRHDYLVNLLQAVVETLLFYHPAVWWLSRRIRVERENCCDDLAVSLCGDPVAYASALADLEGLRNKGGSLALAANGGSLLQRVRRVLGTPPHAGRASGWLAASVAILVMVGVSVSVLGGERSVGEENAGQQAATGQDVDAPPPPPPPSPPAPPEPPEPPVDIDVDDPSEAARELRKLARELSRAIAEQTRDAADLARDLARLARQAVSSHADVLEHAEPAIAGAMAAADVEIQAAVAEAVRAIEGTKAEVAIAADVTSAVEPAIAEAFAVAAAHSEAALAQAAHAVAAAEIPAHAPQPGRSSGSFTWSNDGEKIEVKYEGQVEFTDDDRDVRSLSPGGSLTIRQGGRVFPEHTVEFKAASDGTIERRYWAGRSERPFDPEGRQWLAQVLPRFIRQSGIGAERRVGRIFKTSGARGVLAEIALIEGGFAKGRYFSELLKTPGLDKTAVPEVLGQAGKQIDSDFELARLLISANGLISDDRSRKAYFDAARTIDSDFEMRRVYSSALKNGALAPAILANVLDAATSIESDFELASLLVDVAKLQPLDGATRPPYFRAVSSIDSAFERGRVLKALARRNDLPAESVLEIIRAAQGVDSDFERSQVLLAVARTQRLSREARDAYIDAAGDLGNYEQGRALAALRRGEK